MALEKRILKNTPRQVVVELHGDNGASTISVQELATSDQTVDAANVNLSITAIHYQVGQFANVVRSGNIILNLVAGYDSVMFAETFGFSLNKNPNANVVVNVGSGINSIFLVMSKSEGYNEINRQALYLKDR